MHHALLLACAGLVLTLASCAAPPEPTPGKPMGDIVHFAYIGDGVAIGSEPASIADVEMLAAAGFRTIVSVDGAPPDTAGAEAHAMRAVHVPLGYSSITPAQMARLAQVAGECEAPVFVHCHRGLHRGPVAGACVAAFREGVPGPDLARRLADAGYPRAYPGLYESLEALRPGEHVSAPAPDAPVSNDLARAMAALDRAWSRLERCRRAGWEQPPAHPDIDPAHEAGIVALHLESAYGAMGPDADPAMARLMERSIVDAQAIRDALARADRADATLHARALARRCAACHVAYRDRAPTGAGGTYDTGFRSPGR